MAPLLNAKGQPIKMSFFDLFGPYRPPRSGKATPEKPKKAEESTKTSPKSTAATEASTEATEPSSSEWTRLQELALLGMKAQAMSWKEIDEALPGKDLEDIKKKYRKLYVDAPAESKPKEAEKKKEETKKQAENNKEEAKSDEAKAAEESKKVSANGKKDGKKGKQGKKGQKGKVVAEEAKPEEVQAEETKVEQAKGSLKARATAGETGKGGALKSINGHPIIFVDDDEELDFDELSYLYSLHARYDEQKWMTVDSKFFDSFGKRVGVEKLKEKLASLL